jgi:hypothetical protein
VLDCWVALEAVGIAGGAGTAGGAAVVCIATTNEHTSSVAAMTI